jgi:hypothetical protein
MIPVDRPQQQHLYDQDLPVPAVFTAEEAAEVRYGIHLARIAALRGLVRGDIDGPTCDRRLVQLYGAARKLGAPPNQDWERHLYGPLPTRQTTRRSA